MMAMQKPVQKKYLSQLLDGLAELDPVLDMEIEGIANDSRKLKKGDLFVACDGVNHNASEFVEDAIAAGAVAILREYSGDSLRSQLKVPVSEVSGLSEKAGVIANRFYDEPSKAMNVIGVTGTNGKTSVACFLAQAMSMHNDSPAALIGTLGIGTVGDLSPSRNTTPDCLTIQAALMKMRNAGMFDVIMEVSSHALAQHRVAGTSFKSAIFTNLSHEHQDYHGDMESYAEAKSQLFRVASLDTAIINTDDDFGRQLINVPGDSVQVVTYGLEEGPSSAYKHVRGEIVESKIGSLIVKVDSPWGVGELNTKLNGDFNALNLLASLTAMLCSGIDFEDALKQLSSVSAVPGRMESYRLNNGATVVVDYAHTPDALDKVLTSLRALVDGHLICVFGCGGNRDKEKRAAMGSIAEKLANKVILTNDNPREESANDIITQILSGIRHPENVSSIPDRAEAIETAVDIARPDDLILIAGKGHETSQEISGVRSPFSDRQMIRNLMEASR